MEALREICLDGNHQKNTRNQRQKELSEALADEGADRALFQRKRRAHPGQRKKRGHEPGPHHTVEKRRDPQRLETDVEVLAPVVEHHAGMERKQQKDDSPSQIVDIVSAHGSSLARTNGSGTPDRPAAQSRAVPKNDSPLRVVVIVEPFSARLRAGGASLRLSRRQLYFLLFQGSKLLVNNRKRILPAPLGRRNGNTGV